MLAFAADSWLQAAKSDTLALVWTSPASVDQRRVEPMYIEVLIVDEEALTYGSVSVVVRMEVKLNFIR